MLLFSQSVCLLTDILFHCNFSLKNLKVLTKKNTLRIPIASLLRNTLREKKNKENNSGTNKYLLKGVKRNLIFTSKQNDDIIFSAASDSKSASKITTYMCDIVKKILDLKNLFPYKTYHSSKKVKKKEKESKSSKNMKICEDTLSGKGYNKAAIDNISKQMKKVKRYSTIAISD